MHYRLLCEWGRKSEQRVALPALLTPIWMNESPHMSNAHEGLIPPAFTHHSECFLYAHFHLLKYVINNLFVLSYSRPMLMLYSMFPLVHDKLTWLAFPEFSQDRPKSWISRVLPSFERHLLRQPQASHTNVVHVHATAERTILRYRCPSSLKD